MTNAAIKDQKKGVKKQVVESSSDEEDESDDEVDCVLCESVVDLSDCKFGVSVLVRVLIRFSYMGNV